MIGTRYARALLNLASSAKVGDKIKADMQNMMEVISSEKVKAFITDRTIAPEEKIKLFSGFHDLTVDLVRLAVKNKRENYFKLIALEYIKLYNEKENIEDVEVFANQLFSEKEQTVLRSGIEKSLKKKVNISYLQDKTIVGGVYMKYGNKVVDGTVSGVLMRLLEELTKN